MRKIINFTHATLDGYIDNPHEWQFPFFNATWRNTCSPCTSPPTPSSSDGSPTTGWPKLAHYGWQPVRRPRQLHDEIRRRDPTGQHRRMEPNRRHQRRQPSRGGQQVEAGRRKRCPHLGNRPTQRRARRSWTARRIPHLHLTDHQGRWRTAIPSRQCRNR